MATYVSLVNELLRRINEVPMDTSGDGFGTVRNVQALAKDAINASIRMILQDGQEWPFLKTVHTETLVAGTRQYDYPSDVGSVDWDTFYLKRLGSAENTPGKLRPISYEEYIERHRHSDDVGDPAGMDAPEYVYQTYGEAFGVTPVPDDSYEVEYVYWAAPNDLTEYNDVAIIPDRFKHVVIEGAMVHMMRFRSNAQGSAMHQATFEDLIKAMRRVLIDEPLHLRSTVINRHNGLR